MKINIKILLLSLAIFSSNSSMNSAQPENVEHLFEIRNQPIVYPRSIEELQKLVSKASQEKKKVSLVGAGKSQGGQTVSSSEIATVLA